MKQQLTASELHRRSYKVYWSAYDNQMDVTWDLRIEKVQLPFPVTELITSKTCRKNKSDLKQKKNILTNGSFAKC